MRRGRAYWMSECGVSIPVAVVADSFAGGDSIDHIAEDRGVSAKQVTSAIRFVLIYPKCDLPSFWKKAE